MYRGYSRLKRRGDKAFITHAWEFRDKIQRASELGNAARMQCHCRSPAVKRAHRRDVCIRFWRRVVRTVTCRPNAWHEENAWKCLRRPCGSPYIFQRRDLAATSNNERVWRPKGRCDAVGTARGVPVHPAKALNRKNATAGPDGSISGFLSDIRDTIVERR